MHFAECEEHKTDGAQEPRTSLAFSSIKSVSLGVPVTLDSAALNC
jgi:hypothetical protein